MKRLLFLTLSLCLSLFPVTALAHGTEFEFGYYGTTSISTEFMKADAGANDDFWIDLTVGGSSGQIIWYSYGDEITRTTTPVTSASAPSNANSFKLRSLDGGEVWAVVGHTTNPVSEHVIFSGSDGTGGGGSTPDPDPTPVPDGDDCALCQCLDDLKPVIAAIGSSVDSNGQKLSDIKDGIDSLNNKGRRTNELLDELLGELRTSLSPTMPTMPNPPSLESNKPDMPSTSFEDTNTYFTDRGDDTSNSPKPLPTAPEPENWKNEDGSIVTPDEQLNRDDEFIRDTIPNQDAPNVADAELDLDRIPDKDAEFDRDSEFSQSPIGQQDAVFEMSPILNQDPITNRDDELTRDTENSRDPINSLDSEFTKSPDSVQDNFYEQTPIDRTPPTWKSR